MAISLIFSIFGEPMKIMVSTYRPATAGIMVA
jgi:hypothetical protein